MRISIVKKQIPLSLIALLMLVAAPLFGQDDAPERPTTESLLPETTMMFVQIENVREFMEKSRESGVGQVFDNEKISKLVDSVTEEVTNAYEEVKEEVGLELEDFQNLPQGEITIGIVAPARGDLQYAFFLEVDNESDAFNNVLKRSRELAEENFDGTITEEAEDITFETFIIDENQFTTFEKDGLFVGASSRELVEQILDRWNEIEVPEIRPLTENRKFVTVMNRCRGTKDVPPDLRFFIDPIGLAKGATRGDIGAQTVINFLPILGLDGLSAIGASAIMDELGFESVGHLHVMLANPRAGIIKMLALKPGDYTPEDWVPESVGTYISSSWNINVFFAEMEKIVDTFGGEGVFKSRFDDAWEEDLGLSFREDFLPTFTGRISYMNWLNYPVDYTGQVQVFGIHIEDMERFEKIRDILIEKIESQSDEQVIDEVQYRGSTYWTENADFRESRDKKQVERRKKWAKRRGMDPEEITVANASYKVCIGVIDDVMIVCTNPAFFEAAVDTAQGEKPALVNNDEFVETTDTVAKLVRNDTPGAIFYQQPGKSVEFLLGLIKSEDGRQIEKSFQRNNFSKEADKEEEDQSTGFRMYNGLKRSFEENPLPEFEEIQGLFAPTGGFITNDDTGYHMMTFQLKHDR